MADSQKILYTWTFEDTKNRSALWYMIALALALGLIIWGFLTRQYGMSIVVMLIVGFFYFLENNSEDQVQVTMTDLGISIQNTFYDYARISGYSVIYDGAQAVYLRLYLKKQGISFVNLNINTAIASDLKTFLSSYLEENAKQEITFLEKITHLLKL